MYYGLIPLGIVHLAISLIAVGTGLTMLIRDKQITANTRLGYIYVFTTVLTCLTALMIYQHGSFGKAHILAILTLVAVVVARLAGNTKIFGNASRYVETISYSATFLFHMIPGITEASTRLPYGSPLAASGEDPGVKAATGVLFILFLIGATLQVRKLRSQT